MSILKLSSGLSRLAQKDYAAVHADCIKAIELDVNAPLPFFLLGVIAFDHNNFSKALELFEKAQYLDPAEPYFLAYRAMALSTLRQTHNAREAAERAAAMSGHDAHLSDMIGVVYSRCGFHEKAITHFKAAVAMHADEPNYHFNLAASQQFLGDFIAAKESYEACLALTPKNYRAWSSLISLNKQTEKDNHLSTLKTLFQSRGLVSDAKLHLGHAIAKTLEDLGQNEASLDWLQLAKSDKRKAFPFDRSSAQALFAAAKSTVNYPDKKAVFAQDITPIFIVGLPRTGTTLVDRILSSHSTVTSAGELNAFGEQVKTRSQTSSPFVLDAQTLVAASAIDLALVGRHYQKTTAPLAGGMAYMVDKMPLNFFYAALMTRAFPKVKIIALRRGAMDSCLSNFRQLFSTQFSYYNYTYDLDDTAFFYREFDTLMTHWRGSLSPDRFMEVAYEDIVFDQENQTRRLLDFCDLEFEETCLNFHENTAAVSTASSVQVRQPLYAGSIGRWKKYGDKLDSLKAALGDLVD